MKKKFKIKFLSWGGLKYRKMFLFFKVMSIMMSLATDLKED